MNRLRKRERCPVCGERKCQGEPVCGLKYIAASPPREYGGFHPNAVATAKKALKLIASLRRGKAQL